MMKYDLFKDITDEMLKTYVAKNHDYGDSFGQTYHELGIISAITRIRDKSNRLVSLTTKGKQLVQESIEDTLLDLANYCIMTVIELRTQREQEASYSNYINEGD